MGVSQKEYAIAGYNLDFKKYSEYLDKNYELYDKLHFKSKKAKDTMGVLFDGMNGDYVLAGFCINHGTDNRWDEGGIELTEIDVRDIQSRKEEIDSWLYNNKLVQFIISEYRIFFLSHYS